MNHVETAKTYFKNGFLCSQAVFAAFAVEEGLPEEQALKIGACFGSGMCKGEVCGALTGALMAIGLKYGQCRPGDLASRARCNALTNQMMDKFKEENGSCLCRELLGCDVSIPQEAQQARESGLFTNFCPRKIESAARILAKLLEEADGG